ncbi:MAG: ABC transporter ATP-binding protein [Gammaproteobacteria bacterium]|nr:ABC transporter ATP-binding protein [Gammaproteobacteria bacterium]MDE2345250.1 ABC transporter ATP-binding protein [Gammaproteobacteria bacterium]
MSMLVQARGLSKNYKGLRALDKVDFDIEEGRIVGLIGPNGAGKTTALKAILGLISFDGELDVLGHDPRMGRSRLMQDVCFIADVAVLPRWLRVKHAIEYVDAVHPRFSRERALRFLERTKISQNSRVGQLSKGMVTQLHLALIMAIDARLLILDEPTLGLDILYRKEFYSNLLNDYFDDKRTILVTTHQVEEVEKLLTDLMFINNGRLVLNESMDAVAETYTEVLVAPDKAAAAQELKPIHEREIFGKKLYLFEGVSREQLAGLGELHTPSVADLFVAKMTGAAQ